jgi:hypothetical protein
MEGKQTFGGRNSRSSDVATRLEREGGEERKKGEEEERAGRTVMLRMTLVSLVTQRRQRGWRPPVPPVSLVTQGRHVCPKGATIHGAVQCTIKPGTLPSGLNIE